MIQSYKLTKTWQYFLIVPPVCLLLLCWLPVFFGDVLSGIPGAAWVLLVIISGIAGLLIYGTRISKIITSPEGIESVILGIQVKAKWDKVIRIDTIGGYITLICEESIYRNKLANYFPRFLVSNKAIQLSPFIDDFATSNLLKDVVKYVPNANIPEFAAQQRHWTKTNQKAGVIGLYYFGWFTAWWLFGVFFQDAVEEHLASLRVSNAGPILTFVGVSLVIGLFVSTMSLVQRYNTAIVNSDGKEIVHKARAYYLSPLVTILISCVVAIGIWTFEKTYSDADFEIFLMFLIGILSLWISGRIERFLFRDTTQ